MTQNNKSPPPKGQGSVLRIIKCIPCKHSVCYSDCLPALGWYSSKSRAWTFNREANHWAKSWLCPWAAFQEPQLNFFCRVLGAWHYLHLWSLWLGYHCLCQAAHTETEGSRTVGRLVLCSVPAPSLPNAALLSSLTRHPLSCGAPLFHHQGFKTDLFLGPTLFWWFFRLFSSSIFPFLTVLTGQNIFMLCEFFINSNHTSHSMIWRTKEHFSQRYPTLQHRVSMS